LRIKKLRKLVFSEVEKMEDCESITPEELKEKFSKALFSLSKVTVEKGFATLENGSGNEEEAVKTDEKCGDASRGNDVEHKSKGNRTKEEGNSAAQIEAAANPTGCTRLFLGNLVFSITEESLKEGLKECGLVLHVKWITDKETKKFYGSAFIGMDSASSAGKVMAKNGQDFMGRPLKVNYAPPRPNDIWPPKQKPVFEVRPVSEKPMPGCKKLYIGNLSYDIDDDGIVEFFKECGELQGLRWLTNVDTGEFRGCGFVEFIDSESADKAVLLNGTELLGRQIRIDWDG